MARGDAPSSRRRHDTHEATAFEPPRPQIRSSSSRGAPLTVPGFGSVRTLPRPIRLAR